MNFRRSFEDLDADHLALLSDSFDHIQEKTRRLQEVAALARLTVLKKTKLKLWKWRQLFIYLFIYLFISLLAHSSSSSADNFSTKPYTTPMCGSEIVSLDHLLGDRDAARLLVSTSLPRISLMTLK